MKVCFVNHIYQPLYMLKFHYLFCIFNVAYGFFHSNVESSNKKTIFFCLHLSIYSCKNENVIRTVHFNVNSNLYMVFLR